MNYRLRPGDKVHHGRDTGGTLDLSCGRHFDMGDRYSWLSLCREDSTRTACRVIARTPDPVTCKRCLKAAGRK